MARGIHGLQVHSIELEVGTGSSDGMILEAYSSGLRREKGGVESRFAYRFTMLGEKENRTGRTRCRSCIITQRYINIFTQA